MGAPAGADGGRGVRPVLRPPPPRPVRPGGGGRGPAPDEWRSGELLAMVRELQPDAVVNDRLGIPGDFVTPEQWLPPAPVERGGRRVPWEACHTLNASWGYARDDRAFKTPELVAR